MWSFFSAIGGIIAGVIAVIAAIPLAPAVIGGAIIGGALCLTGVICPNSSNSTSGGGSQSTTITSAQTPTTGTSKPTGTNTTGTKGTNGGNGSGSLCVSTDNLDCPAAHLHNTGTLVNNVCNATVPPTSQCPAPGIDASKGFYAQPTLVKSGQQSTLYWNATSATACTVSGGALNLPGLPLTGNHLTGGITQKTTYTLTCIDGSGAGGQGPVTSAHVTINLIPAFQEI